MFKRLRRTLLKTVKIWRLLCLLTTPVWEELTNMHLTTVITFRKSFLRIFYYTNFFLFERKKLQKRSKKPKAGFTRLCGFDISITSSNNRVQARSTRTSGREFGLFIKTRDKKSKILIKFIARFQLKLRDSYPSTWFRAFFASLSEWKMLGESKLL